MEYEGGTPKSNGLPPPKLLWTGDEFQLSRRYVQRSGEQNSVLSLEAVSDISVSTRAKLRHYFDLRSHLHSSWASMPLELEHRGARYALLLEDVGALPLAHSIQRPLAIAEFLELAIAISTSLANAHQAGVIHKDIKPENILIDEAKGQAWLIGFGFASRLPRERQTPIPPEGIAGTFAYMAPEQTGRMNRSIDARSDLYSLGVTFYQMLTGSLPFDTTDPMEWIHFHVARMPTSPRARNRLIPEVVSDIVMKLLAKAAEDRYQTAEGVRADLRSCLKEWSATSSIGGFQIGKRDATGRLSFQEKLYGREAEVGRLLSALENVIATGIPGLVLVSGFPVSANRQSLASFIARSFLHAGCLLLVSLTSTGEASLTLRWRRRSRVW